MPTDETKRAAFQTGGKRRFQFCLSKMEIWQQKQRRDTRRETLTCTSKLKQTEEWSYHPFIEWANTLNVYFEVQAFGYKIIKCLESWEVFHWTDPERIASPLNTLSSHTVKYTAYFRNLFAQLSLHFCLDWRSSLPLMNNPNSCVHPILFTKKESPVMTSYRNLNQ